MGGPKAHQPVKLIIGFLSKEEGLFLKTKKIFEAKFKSADYTSPIIEFSHTPYYEKEFGSGLKRQFISFKKLIPLENIYKIKLFSNKIENALSVDGRRGINIDPGYLDLGKLTLLTTKDQAHRIYLSKGIYAEVTLFYQNKAFTYWPWTYRDYKTGDYIRVFSEIREIYSNQLKTLNF